MLLLEYVKNIFWKKNIFHYIDKSSVARKFYDRINGEKKFLNCIKIAGSVMSGNGKQHSALTEQERSLIFNTLNVANHSEIVEYDEILLNSNFFF